MLEVHLHVTLDIYYTQTASDKLIKLQWGKSEVTNIYAQHKLDEMHNFFFFNFSTAFVEQKKSIERKQKYRIFSLSV